MALAQHSFTVLAFGNFSLFSRKKRFIELAYPRVVQSTSLTANGLQRAGISTFVDELPEVLGVTQSFIFADRHL